MGKVKVGDKVRITRPYHGLRSTGAMARVVVIGDNELYGLDIEGWTSGHSCNVLDVDCVSGYWVKEGYFEKVATFKGNK